MLTKREPMKIQKDNMINNMVESANKETKGKKLGKSAQWTLSIVVTSQSLPHSSACRQFSLSD